MKEYKLLDGLKPNCSVLLYFQHRTFPFVLDGGGTIISLGVIRPSVSSKRRGPFQALERRDKDFKLQLGSREEWVSIDQRLKVARLPDDPEVASKYCFPTPHILSFSSKIKIIYMCMVVRVDSVEFCRFTLGELCGEYFIARCCSIELW